MNRWAWAITIIQFSADPAKTVRATSWYIWELLASSVFTHTLPSTSDFNPLYYVAGKNDKTGGHIFKAAVYNATTAEVPVKLTFEGVKQGTKAQLTVLTGPKDVYGFNDPYKVTNVVKTTKSTVTAGKDGVFSFKLPNLSVALLDTGVKKHYYYNRAIERKWLSW
jgi:alpha-L-arabinofuranosidase